MISRRTRIVLGAAFAVLVIFPSFWPLSLALFATGVGMAFWE